MHRNFLKDSHSQKHKRLPARPLSLDRMFRCLSSKVLLQCGWARTECKSCPGSPLGQALAGPFPDTGRVQTQLFQIACLGALRSGHYLKYFLIAFGKKIIDLSGVRINYLGVYCSCNSRILNPRRLFELTWCPLRAPNFAPCIFFQTAKRPGHKCSRLH